MGFWRVKKNEVEEEGGEEMGSMSFGEHIEDLRKRLFWAVLAAVATPTTDMLTMMMLFVPLVGLYELGILLARVVVRKREAAEALEG